MSEVSIYHNPRCSKSRQTLEILHQEGIQPSVVLYLDSPPDKSTLKRLVQLLGLDSARDLMRKGEALYREMGLDDPDLNEDELLQAMVEHPILMERPVVVVGNEKAIIGRPPERIRQIL